MVSDICMQANHEGSHLFILNLAARLKNKILTKRSSLLLAVASAAGHYYLIISVIPAQNSQRYTVWIVGRTGHPDHPKLQLFSCHQANSCLLHRSHQKMFQRLRRMSRYGCKDYHLLQHFSFVPVLGVHLHRLLIVCYN